MILIKIKNVQCSYLSVRMTLDTKGMKNDRHYYFTLIFIKYQHLFFDVVIKICYKTISLIIQICFCSPITTNIPLLVMPKVCGS